MGNLLFTKGTDLIKSNYDSFFELNANDIELNQIDMS